MSNANESNNNIKAVKSGIWYTAANFLTKSLGFITTPIFTRLLTTGEYGDFSNYLSWLNILTMVITLNLDSTLISARYDYKKEEFDEYIYSILSLSTISTLIWFAFFHIFNEKTEQIFNISIRYMTIMMFHLIFASAINLFQARERYMFMYKMTVLVSMLITVGSSLLSIALIFLLNDRLFARIIGNTIPYIIIGLIIYVFFIIKGRHIKVRYWKYALPICLPFIPHLLSLTLLNSMDRVMIKNICGSTDTALYSLAYNCGAIVTLLVTSLNSAYAPWLGEKLNEGDHDSIRQFSKKYSAAFFVLAIAIMLVAPEILRILGGPEYQAAVYVIPPVAAGCMYQFLYTMFVNVEQFKKKTAGMAFASVTAALLNYVLNLIFIPRFGYIAAAYTTLAGYLWLLIMHMILVFKLKLRDVYDYGYIIKLVFVVIILTVSVNYIYTQFAARLLIIAVYVIILGIVCIRNKTELYALLTMLRKRN